MKLNDVLVFYWKLNDICLFLIPTIVHSKYITLLIQTPCSWTIGWTMDMNKKYVLDLYTIPKLSGNWNFKSQTTRQLAWFLLI